MSEQKPSVGRIVHFKTSDPKLQFNMADTHAAIITRVWNDTCVNLKVLPDCAPPFDAPSCCLNATYNVSYWTWPPRE